MHRIHVEDLMVPLADYATVAEDATLYDAVLALEQTRQTFDRNRAEPRAVLVLNKDRKVVGKIGYLDVLQGLEPKYAEVDELNNMAVSFTAEFIRAQLAKYNLWAKPLDDICRKAAAVRVKTVMYTPGGTEFISRDAPLDQAVHQLIVDRRQSLLVTSGEEVVGLLRLSDVVEKVCDLIKTCKLQ